MSRNIINSKKFNGVTDDLKILQNKTLLYKIQQELKRKKQLVLDCFDKDLPIDYHPPLDDSWEELPEEFEEESLKILETPDTIASTSPLTDPRVPISFEHFLSCIFSFFKEIFFETKLFFSIFKRLVSRGFFNLFNYREDFISIFRFLKRVFYVLSGIALVYYCILYFFLFIYFCYYFVSRIIHVFFIYFLMLIFKNDPRSLNSLYNFMIKYILPFDVIEGEIFLLPVRIVEFRKKYFSLLALVDKIIDIILYLFNTVVWFQRKVIWVYWELWWFFFIRRFNFNRKYGKFKAVWRNLKYIFYKSKRRVGWRMLYWDIMKFKATTLFNWKQYFYYNLFLFRRIFTKFFYNFIKNFWMFKYVACYLFVCFLRYAILFFIYFCLWFFVFMIFYNMILFLYSFLFL